MGNLGVNGGGLAWTASPNDRVTISDGESISRCVGNIDKQRVNRASHIEEEAQTT